MRSRDVRMHIFIKEVAKGGNLFAIKFTTILLGQVLKCPPKKLSCKLKNFKQFRYDLLNTTNSDQNFVGFLK